MKSLNSCWATQRSALYRCITILAEPYINPNQEGEAAPINIQVVYLNEDSVFGSVNHDQIDAKEGD
ncbi:type VI secretion system lipoprotein TssJ [Proteus mirabilis]